ncbi:hypothetical protein CCR75_004070 [Bremia lactucae]|uniref:Calpain catalytic domain-containing protein n=1 Tax=Bremia lactucae TaxID=4779 RepID=A0A976IJ57_BRELC|nr:hypothetical protein CCR75_004070 [Bremia lactucae]
MAERHYAEAQAAAHQAQRYQRAGQWNEALSLFEKALHIFKRLAVVESAVQREHLQLTIAELTTRMTALQQSSDFLLHEAMTQHAAARDLESSGSAFSDTVARYIAAADTYMLALNALPPSENMARATLKEQIEYVIDYISLLKAKNQMNQQNDSSRDDVDVAVLQWPDPPKGQPDVVLANASGPTPLADPTIEACWKPEDKLMKAYSSQELDVLRRSSQINGLLFVPWVDDLDGRETFNPSGLFYDPDGHVPLSAKQKTKEAVWMRPSDYAASCGLAPVMIAGGGVNPLVVKQDIVTDCSFVASLCIAAAYEQRFKKRLITNIMFPADKRTKQLVYNPYGKYVVKLWANGVPRKVVIDDLLPVSAISGQLLSSCTTRKNELWVSLIEKAYLKLNGGYDFPGGNSGIDLFALTGWIPESILISELHDAPSKEERLWKQLQSAFHFGDCIITMSTGDITKQEGKEIGLVPVHVYAVLNVYELTDYSQNGRKIRLLLVKNPWRKMSWKGPFSRHDKARWDGAIGHELRAYQRQFYATENPIIEKADGLQDQGLFWIDFESVKYYFENLYMNWNPELFPYKEVHHEHWPFELGPVNDSFTLGFNPQYTLIFRKNGPLEGALAAATSCTMWILLSKHVNVIQRGTENSNQQCLTLHVYRGTPGKRVFYNHCAVSRGTYSNNLHTLVSLDLDFASDLNPCFTLVASQYEKVAPLDYTISVFSTRPFSCLPIQQFVTSLPTSVVIAGAWDRACAGGRPLYSTFMDNPQFHLQLQQPLRSLHIFLETEVISTKKKDTVAFPINLRAALHTRERVCGLYAAENADIVDGESFQVLSSGKYRLGFCYIEIDAALLASSLHDIVLIPSTFEQCVLGKFTLRIVSDPPAGTSIAYHQIPAEGHGMELIRLRGKWNLQTGSAAGCDIYGCYTSNPKYLVHVTQECDLLARLLVDEQKEDAARSGSHTTGDYVSGPSINLSVFNSTSDGEIMLSSNPKLAFAGVTSGGGMYVSNARSGVLAKSFQRYSPGWYIIVPSTFESRDLSFELRIYASNHVDVRLL